MKQFSLSDIRRSAPIALLNLQLSPLSTDAGTGVQQVFDRVLKILLALAYPLAFVAIIYSAYLLITSAGKIEAYSAARKNITYLLIGVFIIVFSLKMIQLLLGVFTNLF